MRSHVPCIDALEPRRLLSITIDSHGVVRATGGPDADNFVVRIDADNPDNLQVHDTVVVQTYAASRVKAIVVQGRGGDDRLFVDNSFGFVARAGKKLPITFAGDGGFDQIILLGTAGGAELTEQHTLANKANAGALSNRTGNTTQLVTYAGTDSIIDFAPAAKMTVVGNSTTNLINVTNGPVVTDQNTGLIEAFNVKVRGDAKKKDKDDDQGDEDDDDHGKHGARIVQLVKSEAFAPINFANKTAVVVSGGKGSDFLDVNMPNQPLGLSSLVIDGGKAKDRLAARAAPPGASFSFVGIEQASSQATFTLDEL